MDRNTELRKEQEVLGVFLSGHPAQEIAPILSSNKDGKTLEELSSMGERKYVRTGGMIQNVRVFTQKMVRRWLFLNYSLNSPPCLVWYSPAT